MVNDVLYLRRSLRKEPAPPEGQAEYYRNCSNCNYGVPSRMAGNGAASLREPQTRAHSTGEAASISPSPRRRCDDPFPGRKRGHHRTRKLNQETIRGTGGLASSDAGRGAVLDNYLLALLCQPQRGTCLRLARQPIAGRDAGTLLFQEEPERCVEICRQTLEGGHWSGEIDLTTISGVKRTLFSPWNLVHDEDAQRTSFLVVDTDITDHKRLEERFLRAQRMESIGTLASGVAHDLNNILMPIMVAVDLLRPLASKAEDHETLAMVEQAGRRASDIVKQLLTFGRGVEGRRVGVQLRNLLRKSEKWCEKPFPKTSRRNTISPTSLWPWRRTQCKFTKCCSIYA